MKTPQITFLSLFVLAVWVGLIVGCYAWLLRYSFAAGAVGSVPQTIPAGFASPNAPSRPQLFLALHPHCPCSRATLKELDKIQAKTANASEITVLMYAPSQEPDTWREGALLQECQRRNYRICPDPDGKLAASLGTPTSGTVLLYDARGKLRYQGGITASRGHEGDNPGAGAVIEILSGRSNRHNALPVFGCPITQTTQSVSL